MRTRVYSRGFGLVCLWWLVSASAPHLLNAHCDTLDGPVVKAAQRALAEDRVNFALIWVRKEDEPEIRRAFAQTLEVRKLGPEALKLADHYFFETVVRLHRAGEGAPYTGLKPAGGDPGPAVRAADQALDAREIEPAVHLLSAQLRRAVDEHFRAAVEKKNFAADDLAAGREYVHAYVKFVHFVEAVYQAMTTSTHPHPGETSDTHASAQGSSGQH